MEVKPSSSSEPEKPVRSAMRRVKRDNENVRIHDDAQAANSGIIYSINLKVSAEQSSSHPTKVGPGNRRFADVVLPWLGYSAAMEP
jgi:hypothetical protein